MRTGPIALALVSLALFDCATLDPLGDGACGNGVIDANEDCDGFAPAGVATGKCGGPSEGASACRLQCATNSDCPAGWGCAVSGICREPSGKFGAIGEGVSAGVETLVVGDFDGDRRKDVLGSGPQGPTSTARVRVHYFGDDAELAQVNTLSASISSPTVKDFNKDNIDDFAFGLDIGALGVISGQPDRSLIPAVFPSFRASGVDAKPVIVRAVTRALPDGGTLDFMFAGTFTDAATGTVKVNGLASTDRGYLRPLPVGIEGIIGEPIWGQFFADPTSTCGEVAVALKQGTNGIIQVYAPCRPKVGSDSLAEWAPARAPVIVEPPGPLAGIQIVDETNDGHADLLIAVAGGDGRKVYLARGNAAGFDPPVETAILDLPIASGDLDLDGKADLVLPGGILLSRPPGGGGPIADAGADAGAGGGGETPFRFYTPRLSDRRVRWTSARIGNFNGDGLPDVVAASAEQPDLDFFGAIAPGEFVQSSISTAGPVSHIALGDFDGDQLIDIGFMQKPPGSGAVFDVSVAYARTHGPPEPARVIGRADEAISLETFGDPGVPGIDALALVFRKPTEAALPDIAIAVIIGNGDRQPVAPLLLDESMARTKETDPDIAREWVPLDVHAGTPIDPNRVDLIALAVGYRFSRSRQEFAPGAFPSAVWVAPGTGATSFDAPQQVEDLAGFSVPGSGTVLFEARTAVGDLDNPKDGKSEVVILQRVPAKDALALVVARPSLEEKGIPRSEAIELPGERIRRDVPFTLTDVDGDGNLDAVVILGDVASSKVVVMYNDGSGGFVTPGTTITLGEGELPRGFAPITTTGASIDGKRLAKRELAIVTSRRLFLAAPDASDRTKLVTRDVATEGGAALVGATAIANGDFDGDGVDDLAIADSGTLRILRQLPVRR